MPLTLPKQTLATGEVSSKCVCRIPIRIPAKRNGSDDSSEEDSDSDQSEAEGSTDEQSSNNDDETKQGWCDMVDTALRKLLVGHEEEESNEEEVSDGNKSESESDNSSSGDESTNGETSEEKEIDAGNELKPGQWETFLVGPGHDWTWAQLIDEKHIWMKRIYQHGARAFPNHANRRLLLTPENHDYDTHDGKTLRHTLQRVTLFSYGDGEMPVLTYLASGESLNSMAGGLCSLGRLLKKLPDAYQGEAEVKAELYFGMFCSACELERP